MDNEIERRSKHKSLQDRDSERSSKKRHRRDDERRRDKKKAKKEEAQGGIKIIDDDPDKDMWIEKNIDMDGEHVGTS